jgi:hypothetical protein
MRLCRKPVEWVRRGGLYARPRAHLKCAPTFLYAYGVFKVRGGHCDGHGCLREHQVLSFSFRKAMVLCHANWAASLLYRAGLVSLLNACWAPS